MTSTRTSLESLSGIRLIGFVFVCLIQGVSLVSLSVLPVHLNPHQLHFLFVVLSAIVTIAAVVVCNLSCSLPGKLAIIVLLLTWTMWILRWISLPSDLETATSTGAATIILQVVLLVSGFVILRVVSGDASGAFRFGIAGLFFLSASVALSVLILRYVFLEWPIELLVQQKNANDIVAGAVVNVCWCFFLLVVYLPYERMGKNAAIAGALVIVALATEYWLTTQTPSPTFRWEPVFARLLYITWVALSLIPIFRMPRTTP